MSCRLKIALLSGLAAIAVASSPMAAPQSWPQTTSDVAADPAARFGVLPNGMLYVVMRNATPGGVTSLRLRIGSGSLEESDAEQGLAHMLEHMAFKGSTHVPEGEMIRILQRKGLAFGPDTNAATEWTQTVYMLDLPKSDAGTIDTGLMLMRETGSELTIDETALASERGVVLSEERLRDTPEYQAEKAQIDLLVHGQLAVRRFPIGQVDIIKHAPATQLRAFYRANYRPGRAALIAVGDFDPAEMEARIKARFSDWTPVGPETAAPDLGQVEHRGLTVKLVQLPGAQTQVQIAWARPYDASPDSLAKRRRETVESLALAVLNRRLAKMALSDDPPFLDAGAAFQNVFQSDKVALIAANTAPGAWKPALGAVDEEVRRLAMFGVTQAELAREIAQERAGLVNAQAGRATRPTPDLASGLVESVDSREVFTGPVEDLRVFDAAVAGLTPAEVDAAARAVFAGDGPLVELTTPAPVAGGEAAVSEAYQAAHVTPVTALAAEAVKPWPYAAFGPPGAVAERRDIADLGAVVVRFANGVQLTVKSTDNRKDQIMVAVNIGAGRLELPRDHPTAAWAASALTDGGLQAIDLDDLQRTLNGKIYGAAFAVGDDAFELRGATRPEDLATQFQVLAAYVADPGFRPEAFERLKAAYLTALPQLSATPDGVLERDLEQLLRAGDPRWATPGASELAAAKPSDLAALLKGPLANDPLEITVVGDVSADQAIAAVAQTFGALPPRPAPGPPPADGEKLQFPAPTVAPVVLTDSGRADQAVAMVAWPLTDFFENTRASRAAMLAGDVLENRVLDEVRVKQGATYSPETRVSLSETFPHYGFAFTTVEMPPEKIPGFFADVARITADMREKGITADELERARNPRVAGLKKAQLTNPYWLSRLAGAMADPRQLMLIRTTFSDYEAVTTADIQAAARAWFVDDKGWKLVVKSGAAP